MDELTRARPRDSARRRGLARTALAAVLLALVAVGLRGAMPRPALDGPYHHDGLLIGVVLEVVLAGLLVALAVRGARAPREALLAARLRRLLAYVVVAMFIAIPVLYLVSRHVRPAAPRQTAHPRSTIPPLIAHGHVHLSEYSTAAAIFSIIVLVLVFGALTYLLVILRWRRIRARRWHVADAAEEPGDAEDEATGLRRAVESGRAALRGLDDARAAIVACYAAMEDSLARAGTARQLAETPDELLARAAAAGLVHGAGAARLTALFYEARFSSHPVPPGRRDEAERALGEIRADLRYPAPAADRSGGD